jgi:hypothetical protein
MKCIHGSKTPLYSVTYDRTHFPLAKTSFGCLDLTSRGGGEGGGVQDHLDRIKSQANHPLPFPDTLQYFTNIYFTAVLFKYFANINFALVPNTVQLNSSLSFIQKIQNKILVDKTINKNIWHYCMYHMMCME